MAFESKHTLKLNRKPETLSKLGLSKSTFHTRINEGLFPPPISLGGRAVAWLESETDSVIAALAAGKSKAEIKTLVRFLIEQRKDLLEVIYA